MEKQINRKWEKHPQFKKLNYMYNQGALTKEGFFKLCEEWGFLE